MVDLKLNTKDAISRKRCLGNIRCDTCSGWQFYTHFDHDMVVKWWNTAEAITCKKCVRGHGNEKRAEIEILQCTMCAHGGRGEGVPTVWPITGFLDEDIVQFREYKTPLVCAACKAEQNATPETPSTQKCTDCHVDVPLRGPPNGFSPIFLRRYLEGWGNRSTQGASIKGDWKCYSCQYPMCNECGQRPTYAKPSLTKGGKYFCSTKCRWPPCDICKKQPRPESTKYTRENRATAKR